jgi:hypothetical protein
MHPLYVTVAVTRGAEAMVAKHAEAIQETMEDAIDDIRGEIIRTRKMPLAEAVPIVLYRAIEVLTIPFRIAGVHVEAKLPVTAVTESPTGYVLHLQVLLSSLGFSTSSSLH